MKENKKFIKEMLIILLVGIVVNAACFLMPLNVKAASDSSYKLPYNVYDGNNSFNTFYNDTVSSILHNNSTISAFLSGSDSYIIVPWSANPSNMYFRIIKNPAFDDTIDINSFNYEIQSLTVSANSSLYFQVYFYSNGNPPVISGITQSNTPTNYLILGQSNVTNFINDTKLRVSYPVELSSNIMKNGDNETILVYSQTFNPESTEFIDSSLIDSQINPTSPNLPQIEAPTIDTNLSVIENIKALFQWFGNLFKTLLNWVINSILNFFSNLITNIKNFINAIITAINNGFKNIYNNFKSLFYPFIAFFTAYAQGMQDFIDEITDPNTGIISFLKLQIANIVEGIASFVDGVIAIKQFLFGIDGFFDTYGVIWNQETWEEALDNNEWLNATQNNTAIISQFFNGTLNVAEPQTPPVFTLDFRNSYYNFGLCEINFSWYEPYKHSVRLAFVAICVLNVVLYFIDEAPNWFSGGGSNKKGDK